MRRFLFHLLAAVFLVPASLAAPQQTQSVAAGQLQVQVPLVLEDVVVQGTKNQPVDALQGTNFTITDDGKAITPQSFEEHGAHTPAQPQDRRGA